MRMGISTQKTRTKPGSSRPKWLANASRPKYALSKEEEAELRAVNKCFRCKEEGHLARNCPRAHVARSTGDRPPGISAYGMSINLEETEQLRVSSLEEITELTIGALSLWDAINKEASHCSSGPPSLQTVSASVDDVEDCYADASPNDGLVQELWGERPANPKEAQRPATGYLRTRDNCLPEWSDVEAEFFEEVHITDPVDLEEFPFEVANIEE
ncbi:hypothetical protein H2248_007797 [Termitomyces sp. 'cryptogamus']|nr:hypothetical protein H2248_007797 [Termitomyces sp. 'cryptogamus']